MEERPNYVEIARSLGPPIGYHADTYEHVHRLVREIGAALLPPGLLRMAVTCV